MYSLSKKQVYRFFQKIYVFEQFGLSICLNSY